jgi:hypothetical protein
VRSCKVFASLHGESAPPHARTRPFSPRSSGRGCVWVTPASARVRATTPPARRDRCDEGSRRRPPPYGALPPHQAGPDLGKIGRRRLRLLDDPLHVCPRTQDCQRAAASARHPFASLLQRQVAYGGPPRPRARPRASYAAGRAPRRSAAPVRGHRMSCEQSSTGRGRDAAWLRGRPSQPPRGPCYTRPPCV